MGRTGLPFHSRSKPVEFRIASDVLVAPWYRQEPTAVLQPLQTHQKLELDSYLYAGMYLRLVQTN